jgi:hypothetical protein
MSIRLLYSVLGSSGRESSGTAVESPSHAPDGGGAASCLLASRRAEGEGEREAEARRSSPATVAREAAPERMGPGGGIPSYDI